MKSKTIIMVILFILTVVLVSTPGYSERAMRVADALWANGSTYDTILTPTSFKAPPMHSTDILWDFSMSGLQGQRGVAASAPGDRDYNGGRWSVKKVIFTDLGLDMHDPDGDEMVNFELTSKEEVMHHKMLGHIEMMDTDIYFECPLLRSKSN
jgi:hypothetical protein